MLCTSRYSICITDDFLEVKTRQQINEEVHALHCFAKFTYRQLVSQMCDSSQDIQEEHIT